MPSKKSHSKKVVKCIKQPPKEEKKRKKRNSPNFNTYIKRVVHDLRNQTDPVIASLDKKALSQVNNIVSTIIQELAERSGKFARIKGKTLSLKAMQAANNAYVKDELAKHGNNNGMLALNRYKKAMEQ